MLSSDPASAPASGHHMFGIFPNYATVEGTTDIPPIGSREKFRLARLNSFDRDVFPFVAVIRRHHDGLRPWFVGICETVRRIVR